MESTTLPVFTEVRFLHGPAPFLMGGWTANAPSDVDCCAVLRFGGDANGQGQRQPLTPELSVPRMEPGVTDRVPCSAQDHSLDAARETNGKFVGVLIDDTARSTSSLGQ